MEEETAPLTNKKNREYIVVLPQSAHIVGLRNTTEKIFWGVVGGLILIIILKIVF